MADLDTNTIDLPINSEWESHVKGIHKEIKAQKESRLDAQARDAWEKGLWTDAQGIRAWKLGEVRDPEYWISRHVHWLPREPRFNTKEMPLTDEEILARTKAVQEERDAAAKAEQKARRKQAKEDRRKAKAEARKEKLVEWTSMALMGMIAFLTLNSLLYIFFGVHFFEPETKNRALVLVVMHGVACVVALMLATGLVSDYLRRSR